MAAKPRYWVKKILTRNTMSITRRSFCTAALFSLPLIQTARAESPAAPSGDLSSFLSERSIGKADAKVTVMEFFSLTCTHCAAFSQNTLPELIKKQIDTGHLRIVFRDFPLDQVALSAAMVARALPPERYEPFISALFASQDRWAFNRDGNVTESLAQMALLAGLSRAKFDAVINNEALKRAMLERQQQDSIKYNINSTPTFALTNGKTQSGALSYSDFVSFAGLS
ncbi:Thiol:disulfide interchange protein dsbA [Granulibacter bethesdensis]|nr:Thiol:disulfide interchange protein dsbA [Granulibacter bethesdensis]